MPTVLRKPYTNLAPGTGDPSRGNPTPILGRGPSLKPIPGNLDAPAGSAANPSPKSVLTARDLRPNQGGTMIRAGRPAVAIPKSQSAAARTFAGPDLMNDGGRITGRGRTINVMPSPRIPLTPLTGPQALRTPGAPVASPTTVAAPQTEARNPLSGSGNQQAGGTTDIIGTTGGIVPQQAGTWDRSEAPITSLASPLGFSSRGMRTPAGMDAQSPRPSNGLYGNRFRSLASMDRYRAYAQRVTGLTPPVV